VEVGDGRRTPASIRDLLRSRNRAAAGPTAPPAGLYLVRVDYDAAGPVSFV
jgi:tRNA pseudouridine38-40 synthase